MMTRKAIRWSQKVEDGMQAIRAQIDAELDARELTAIRCTALDADGEDISPCGRCEECHTFEAMALAHAHIDQIIAKHRKGHRC
jgi:hypothetical protein